MLKQWGDCGAGLKRRLENRHGFVERRTRTKIGIRLAGLQYAGGGPLVAIHADVIRQPEGQLGRIDNRPVYFAGERQFPASLIHMKPARPVAVLAADRQLLERRIPVSPGAIRNRLRPAAVTRETGGRYGAAEPGVLLLVAGRKVPTADSRIVA